MLLNSMSYGLFRSVQINLLKNKKFLIIDFLVETVFAGWLVNIKSYIYIYMSEGGKGSARFLCLKRKRRTENRQATLGPLRHPLRPRGKRKPKANSTDCYHSYRSKPAAPQPAADSILSAVRERQIDPRQ